MRALTLITAAVISLIGAGCELEEPNTPAGARVVAYEPAPPVGQDQTGQQQAADQTQPLWPRRFTSGDTSFATYEPMIDSWQNDKLVAHAPVEAFAPGATTPKYGLVWFEAPTETDQERGLVRLKDVRVLRVHFPTATDREATYLEALRGAELPESRTVALDRLQHQVAYGANRQLPPPPPPDTTPPAIVLSDRPEMLVMVDGAPQFHDEGGIQRVTNTRALLLREGTSFYMWIGDRWFRSPSLDGSYTETREVPAAVDAAKLRLASSSSVDLFADATDLVRQGANVAVATKPTEVIETRGAPVYERIPNTTLSYLSNTDSDVLHDDATNQTYLLLSGRWLRAPSLNGPWAYVDAKDLPPSIRNIPRDHREARVLASIPGMPEAEEAAIAAAIPQTATVDRSHANLSVAYEGQPDFRPVEGASAPLKYAINSTTPVIAASDGMYYAVEDGVWFVSSSPNGPWTVATSVPEAIYTIPTSSPIHYVTYVRVYGYSPDYAYVGYTPGYLGAFYTGGVVVFDPGYRYRPWVGRSYYGRPYYPRYAYARPGWGWRGPSSVGRANVYTRWRPSVVYAPPAHAAFAPRAGAAPRTYAPPASAPRVMTPASPSVGRGGFGGRGDGRLKSRVVAPPSAPQSIPPRVTAPPTRSFTPPGAAQPIPPRVTAPPTRSFTPPGAAQPIPPRVTAPPTRSFTPPSAPPPSRGSVIQAAPGSAARAVPPTFAPPSVAPPRAAPPAAAPPARGGNRNGRR